MLSANREENWIVPRKVYGGAGADVVRPQPGRNLDKALTRVSDAAGKGANVVCLPELFQTQYFCQREDHALFDLAEPIPALPPKSSPPPPKNTGSSSWRHCSRSARPASITTRLRCSNRDGSLRGIYRKMHIPEDPLYYEKFYFTPGDLGFRSFDTGAGKIGTLVCWDQWYPEGARLTALQGATLIFYPTAIGWHPSEKAEFGEVQYDAWRTIQRAMPSRMECMWEW